MAYCETHEFFDEISALLKQLSGGITLSSDQSKKLKKLLDRWDSIICPSEGCTQAKCRYAKPIDWVEYHGFTCLFNLIEHLDQRKKLIVFLSRTVLTHWPLRGPEGRAITIRDLVPLSSISKGSLTVRNGLGVRIRRSQSGRLVLLNRD